MKKPLAIDLFSGCGGLTLGLKQAGFNVVGAVEIDPLAVETYRANHKRVKIWQEDIRKISGKEVLAKLGLKPGELDLLAGCPPCQGFSTMTTKNGRVGQDERNDLVFQYLRFVRVLRPKAVMLENVPGLAKNRRSKQLQKALRKLGYKLNQDVLNARDYGVPQRRRRYILLGAKGTKIPFGNKTRRPRTVRETFKKISPAFAKRDSLHKVAEKRNTQMQRLIRKIPHDGGSRSDLGARYKLDCHKKVQGFHDVYGRMAWDAPSPTITGGCCNPSKGRFLHPTKNRNITLREAALLQSFPRTYIFSLRRGKFPAAQMIGNALPPEFIRRHAAQVISVLSKVKAAEPLD